MTNFIDDDENVKAMRETAQAVGLTALLIDMRRELVEALTLLGVSGAGQSSPPLAAALSDEPLCAGASTDATTKVAHADAVRLQSGVTE